eukprot:scaffold169700_cov41-Prasinocladus_malaysianus.AAC.1
MSAFYSARILLRQYVLHGRISEWVVGMHTAHQSGRCMYTALGQSIEMWLGAADIHKAMIVHFNSDDIHTVYTVKKAMHKAAWKGGWLVG